jgi:predicted Zn-dependent protease
VEAYDKALKLPNPNPALIKIAFAAAIISLNSDDKDLLNVAIQNLLSAKKQEKDSPEVFKQLAAAYSQKNDLPHAYLALAELNLLINKNDKAAEYAKLAKDKLDKADKASLLQADDIAAIAKKDKEKERK